MDNKIVLVVVAADNMDAIVTMTDEDQRLERCVLIGNQFDMGAKRKQLQCTEGPSELKGQKLTNNFYTQLREREGGLCKEKKP